MLNISDLSVTTRKYVYDVLNTKIFKVRTIVHVTDIGRQKSSTSKDKLFIGAKELTIKANKKRQKETEAHRKLTDRKSYRQKNQEKVSNIAQHPITNMRRRPLSKNRRCKKCAKSPPNVIFYKRLNCWVIGIEKGISTYLQFWALSYNFCIRGYLQFWVLS